MTEQPTVLQYATPPPRRSLREVVAPRHLAQAAGIIAGLSLLAPLDIGSGRVIVNPLRVLGCAAAVACVILCAIMRLWEDRDRGVVRAWVFGICLFVCTAAFSYAHWSRWGFKYNPLLSLQHDYWQAWLVFACAVSVAVVAGGVAYVLRRRSAAG